MVERYVRGDAVWRIRGNPEFPEHDQAGFRNPDAPGNDLFVVGDSWTYGFGLAKAESWPMLLSERFGVTCAAVGGWGPFEYFLAVRELMPAATKVAVIGFYVGNDLHDALHSLGRTRSPDRGRFWRDELANIKMDIKWNNRSRNRGIEAIMADEGISLVEAYDRAHEIGDLDVLSLRVDGERHVFKPRQRAYLSDISLPLARNGFELAKAMFEDIIQICDNEDVEPYFVLFPTKEACFAASGSVAHPELDIVLNNEKAVTAELTALFREHHVKFVNTLDVLAQDPKQHFRKDSIDGHPNRVGARAIADRLTSVLKPLVEEFDSNNYPMA